MMLSSRERTVGGIAYCGEGTYRMVIATMNGDTLKSMTPSIILQEDSAPSPGFKAGMPLVLALPRREVIIKTIRVPSTDQRQIEQMVAYESTAQLPWPPEESQVSYDILECSEPEYSDLILFMCRRDTVQGHIANLKRWGLAPSRVEVSFVSAGRLLLHCKEESPALLVVDSGGMEYARYSCGRHIYSRGTNTNEPVADMLGRSMQIDSRISADGRCVSVYVAGNAAPNPQALTEAIGPHVSIKPVSDIEFPCQAGTISVETADAVCLGAAIGAIDPTERANLLPDREMRQVALRRILEQAKTLIVAALWLMIALGAMGYYAFNRELHRAERAEAEIKAMEAQVGNLKEQNDALELLADERNRVSVPLQVVLELYSITPQNIAINSLVYDSRRTLSFGGEAPSFRAAYEYMDALLKSRMFQNLEMRSATQPQPGKDSMVEFKITCDIMGAA